MAQEAAGIYPERSVTIAREAGQAEIAEARRPFVMLGDDVIDLEWQIVIFLGKLAIFATSPGPRPGEFLECPIHGCSLGFGFAFGLGANF